MTKVLFCFVKTGINCKVNNVIHYKSKLLRTLENPGITFLRLTLQSDCINYFIHLYYMRWKTTILLIYILGLLAVPCSDVYNSCEDTPSNQTELTHSHSDDNDDHCTPFCQCSCCSVSALKFTFKLPEFNLPQQLISVRNVVLRDCQVISLYSGSIWQPPKLFV